MCVCVFGCGYIGVLVYICVMVWICWGVCVSVFAGVWMC